jgi:hypothetical protein
MSAPGPGTSGEEAPQPSGYGKPPRANQFRRGQSGNSKRPAAGQAQRKHTLRPRASG